MATRKKRQSTRRKPTTRRPPSKRKDSSAKKAGSRNKKRSRSSGNGRAKTSARGRGFGGGVRGLVAGQIPPPISGVPRSEVGKTVQRFIDWDGVSELSVLEEALGTFQVTPLA